MDQMTFKNICELIQSPGKVNELPTSSKVSSSIFWGSWLLFFLLAIFFIFTRLHLYKNGH